MAVMPCFTGWFVCLFMEQWNRPVVPFSFGFCVNIYWLHLLVMNLHGALLLPHSKIYEVFVYHFISCCAEVFALAKISRDN
ncbi:Uncharacterized protein TCM_030189 [Theobroma cacao]|uniref:Uncharacterized protein n=1 Tax=Theobroma cacao TaxID=3641 RepID=A0A061GFJ5_THECC|nr:Uncharacterized protein TCM_030189 [Theobroma cacao]